MQACQTVPFTFVALAHIAPWTTGEPHHTRHDVAAPPLVAAQRQTAFIVWQHVLSADVQQIAVNFTEKAVQVGPW